VDAEPAEAALINFGKMTSELTYEVAGKRRLPMIAGSGLPRRRNGQGIYFNRMRLARAILDAAIEGDLNARGLAMRAVQKVVGINLDSRTVLEESRSRPLTLAGR
jgi:hypothetical protein